MDILPQDGFTDTTVHQEYVKPIAGGFEIDVLSAIQAGLYK